MKDHCMLNFTLSQKLKLNVKNESYSSKLSKRMDFFYFRRFCLDICTLESVMCYVIDNRAENKRMQS